MLGGGGGGRGEEEQRGPTRLKRQTLAGAWDAERAGRVVQCTSAAPPKCSQYDADLALRDRIALRGRRLAAAIREPLGC